MQSSASPRLTRLKARLIVRDPMDRVLTGAAAGLGRRLGVDPLLVRVAFGVLALAGGAGVLAYAALAGLSIEPAPGTRLDIPRRSGGRQVLAVGCITIGALLLLREAGWWFGDRFVWPIALAGAGAMLIWGTSASTPPQEEQTDELMSVGRGTAIRIGAGALLVMSGMVTFIRTNSSLYPDRAIGVPAIVTLFGITLIFGPWLWRLAIQLAEERRDRIRSEERSEMAAHLHDSVLQSLALIQRAKTAKEMATLARVQERELRAWLYSKRPPSDERTLIGAIERIATSVETTEDVTVETVIVGDAELNDRLRALVAACGEATMNAARHSGARSISVYVEVGPDSATAYVRDQGRGFDVEKIPADRGGIAQSIRGRLERWGGSATVTSALGSGTEVHLELPLEKTRR